MPSPFEIRAKEVAALSPEGFVHLVNRLIEIEANIAGLPASCVSLSENIDAPDGGIDADVDASLAVSKNFIPAGRSIWQFKTAQRFGLDAVRKELGKPDVRKAIEQGATYVLLVSQEKPLPQQVKLRAAMQEEISTLRKDARCQILEAKHIAQWATRHPATHYLLGRTTGGLQPAENALQLPEHDYTYIAIEKRDAEHDDLVKVLRSQDNDTHVRIVGPPGVGKTRFALEFSRDISNLGYWSGCSESVFEHLQQWSLSSDVTGVFIIDDCDPAQAVRAGQLVESAGGRLRVLTIGHDHAIPSPTTVELGPFPEDSLRDIVQRTSGNTLADHQVNWIVRRTGGFPQLARELAKSLVSNPSAKDLSDLRVGDLVDRLIPNREDRQVLSVVALLSHIDFTESDGEGQSEIDLLAAYMGINSQSCRRSIETDTALQPYIRRAGRFRYITPDLLAIWLATEEWRSSPKALLRLASQLSEDAQVRFRRRVERLALDDEAVGQIGTLLGSDGFFSNLTDLESRTAAQMFRQFSIVAPKHALTTLQHLILNSTSDELYQLKEGRRDTVFTLAQLARQPENFLSASRLLLKLAAAENEHWSNNAGGVLRDLFRPATGQTTANGVTRVTVLTALTMNSSDIEAVVATAILERAIDEPRGSYAITDTGGRLPEEPWRPTTWGEYRDYVQGMFKLLAKLIVDKRDAVREAARQVFLDRFRILFQLDLGDEALNIVDSVELSKAEQRRLRLCAKQILKWDMDSSAIHNETTDRLQKLIESVYSETLEDRIQRTLDDRWDLTKLDDDEKVRESMNPIEMFHAFAKEAIDDELPPAPLIEWIATTLGPSLNDGLFMAAIGKVDQEFRWLSPLRIHVAEGGSEDMIVNYLLAVRRHDEAANDRLLEDWLTDLETRSIALAVYSRIPLTNDRIHRILAWINDGEVAFTDLPGLTNPNLDHKLSIGSGADLISALTRQGEDGIQAAAICVWRFIRHDSIPNTDLRNNNAFVDAVWEIVEAPWPSSQKFHDGMRGFWLDCCEFVMPIDSVRLMHRVLDIVCSDDGRISRYPFGRLVKQGLESNPKEVWAVFAGRFLTMTYGVRFSVRSWTADENLAESVKAEIILDWIKENKPFERAIAVAEMIRLEDKLPQIVIALITQFGPDSEVAREIATDTVRSWSGGMTDMIKGRQQAALRWAEDENLPSVIREWAFRVADDLAEQVAGAKKWDEESEVLIS